MIQLQNDNFTSSEIDCNKDSWKTGNDWFAGSKPTGRVDFFCIRKWRILAKCRWTKVSGKKNTFALVEEWLDFMDFCWVNQKGFITPEWYLGLFTNLCNFRTRISCLFTYVYYIWYLLNCSYLCIGNYNAVKYFHNFEQLYWQNLFRLNGLLR